MPFRWDQIQALEGTRLKTTSQGEPFTVVSVDDQRIIITIGPQGRRQVIVKGQFGLADSLGLITVDVTPTQLTRASIAGGRTAYAAAIIRALFQSSDPVST